MDFFLSQVAAALNELPAFSIFSTADGPNASGITASVGAIGIEIGSSGTKLWQKIGPSSTTGWASISTV
jgi:hypothetical protein